jgi:hypothetical protein
MTTRRNELIVKVVKKIPNDFFQGLKDNVTCVLDLCLVRDEELSN